MAVDHTGGRTGNSMANVWASLTRSMLRGATATNRAVLAPFVPDESSDEKVPPGVPSVAHDDVDWHFERTVDDAEDIAVGDVVTFEKTITEVDVRAFAEVSGDTNRLHLDGDFAEETRFGERIAHGTLVSGLISAALARLPGMTIYLSQDLSFLAPVAVGDRVRARVEVVEDLGDGRMRLSTAITVVESDTTVIDGEAVVLIDELPSTT